MAATATSSPRGPDLQSKRPSDISGARTWMLSSGIPRRAARMVRWMWTPWLAEPPTEESTRAWVVASPRSRGLSSGRSGADAVEARSQRPIGGRQRRPPRSRGTGRPTATSTFVPSSSKIGGACGSAPCSAVTTAGAPRTRPGWLGPRSCRQVAGFGHHDGDGVTRKADCLSDARQLWATGLVGTGPPTRTVR